MTAGLILYFGFVGFVFLILFGLYLAFETRRWSRPGTVLATIHLENGDEFDIRRVMKEDKETKIGTFSYRTGTYFVKTDMKYAKRKRKAMGLVTVPHLTYLAGVYNPMDWSTVSFGKDVGLAAELKTMMENHVASDVIKAFAKEVIDPLLIAAGTVLILVAVVVITNHQTNGKIGKLSDALLTPTPVVEVTQ